MARTSFFFIKRTDDDRVGQEVELVVDLDGLCHDLPHETPVYDINGVFVGSVIAHGGVWKATLDGDTRNTAAWASTVHRAVINVGLLSCGNL
jgi:hypothetical protein